MRLAMKQYLEPATGTSKNKWESRNWTRKRVRYMRAETPLINEQEDERLAVQGERGVALLSSSLR